MAFKLQLGTGMMDPEPWVFQKTRPQRYHGYEDENSSSDEEEDHILEGRYVDDYEGYDTMTEEGYTTCSDECTNDSTAVFEDPSIIYIYHSQSSLQVVRSDDEINGPHQKEQEDVRPFVSMEGQNGTDDDINNKSWQPFASTRKKTKWFAPSCYFCGYSAVEEEAEERNPSMTAKNLEQPTDAKPPAAAASVVDAQDSKRPPNPARFDIYNISRVPAHCVAETQNKRPDPPAMFGVYNIPRVPTQCNAGTQDNRRLPPSTINDIFSIPPVPSQREESFDDYLYGWLPSPPSKVY